MYLEIRSPMRADISPCLDAMRNYGYNGGFVGRRMSQAGEYALATTFQFIPAGGCQSFSSRKPSLGV